MAQKEVFFFKKICQMKFIKGKATNKCLFLAKDTHTQISILCYLFENSKIKHIQVT